MRFILMLLLGILPLAAQNRVEPTIFLYINDSAILECRAEQNVRPALRYRRVQTKQEANLELLILEGKTEPAGKGYILAYKQIPATNQYINPTEIILSGRTALERCSQLHQRINESSWLVANSPHHVFQMPQMMPSGTMSRADDGWRNLPPPPPPRRAQLPTQTEEPSRPASGWRTAPPPPPPNPNRPLVLPNPVHANGSSGSNAQPPRRDSVQTPTQPRRPVMVLPNPINPNVRPNNVPPPPKPQADSLNRSQNQAPSTRIWNRGALSTTVSPNSPTTPPTSSNNTPTTSPSSTPPSPTANPINFPQQLAFFTECEQTDGSVEPNQSTCSAVNRMIPNVNQFMQSVFQTALSAGLSDVSIRIIPEANTQEMQYSIIAIGQQQLAGYDTLFVSTLPLNSGDAAVFEGLSKDLGTVHAYYDGVKRRLIAANQAAAQNSNVQPVSPGGVIATGSPTGNVVGKWKNWSFVTNLSGSLNTGFGTNKMYSHGFLGTNIGNEWIQIGGYALDYSNTQSTFISPEQRIPLGNGEFQLLPADTTQTNNTVKEFKFGYLLGKPLTEKITVAFINNVVNRNIEGFVARSSGGWVRIPAPNFQPLKLKHEILFGVEFAPQEQRNSGPDLRIRYLFGMVRHIYSDTTYASYIPLSKDLSQNPLAHELTIQFNHFGQKYSANLNFTGSNFFDHYREPRISGSGSINYRITQSFSVNLNLNVNHSPNTSREFQVNPFINNTNIGMRLGFNYSFGARGNTFLRIFQNALPQYANAF